MNPYYEDDSITLFLADSSQFIYHYSPPSGVVIGSDPPNDRASDIAMWTRLRQWTGSLHITANVGVLDQWFAVLRASGFGFERATPWPRVASSIHGDDWDALLNFGDDPGPLGALDGDADFTHETEFPGERNRWEWERVLGRVHGLTLFDPFPGSGSLLVAAANLGWKAVGVEIEQRFADMSVERFRRRVADL